MDITGELIQNNFSAFATIGLLLVFLYTNRSFEREIAKLFVASTITLIIVIVATNFEYMSVEMEFDWFARYLILSINQIARPAISLTILLIVLRKLPFKVKIWLVIPVVFNVCFAFVVLFSGLASSAMKEGGSAEEIVNCIYQIPEVIYSTLLIAFALKILFVDKVYSEAMAIFAILAVSTLAMMVKMKYGTFGILNTTTATIIVFYYVFYHIQSYKRDILTGALNRRCFYIDAEKNYTKLTAVISIDLNNLKYLNDNYGHSEGDKAICTMADVVRHNMLPGCQLYRTGGDEFQMLCMKHSINELYNMVDNIQQKMRETPYRWAMGVSDIKLGKNLEEVMKQADETMYANKKKMKKAEIKK